VRDNSGHGGLFRIIRDKKGEGGISKKYSFQVYPFINVGTPFSGINHLEVSKVNGTKCEPKSTARIIALSTLGIRLHFCDLYFQNTFIN
jgi:hypothetical protein